MAYILPDALSPEPAFVKMTLGFGVVVYDLYGDKWSLRTVNQGGDTL